MGVPRQTQTGPCRPATACCGYPSLRCQGDTHGRRRDGTQVARPADTAATGVDCGDQPFRPLAVGILLALPILDRLGLTNEDIPGDHPADLQEAAHSAIKRALWPNQNPYRASPGNLNPGPANPNPLSGAQPQQAQPLIPADQSAPQPAQQAQQPPAQQPGAQSPSPLFSVPHPPSDTANWLHMVQAPFLPDLGGETPPSENAVSSKMARLALVRQCGLDDKVGCRSWLIVSVSYHVYLDCW